MKDKNKESLRPKKEEEIRTEMEIKPSPGNPPNDFAEEKAETVPPKKEEGLGGGTEGQSSPSGLTAELLTEEAQESKPLREHFPYLGMDSTAVIDFEILSVGDEDEDEEEKERVQTWLERTKGPKVDANAELQSGTKLARDISKAYNKLINVTGKNLTEREIALGKIFLRQKRLTKAANFMWGPWAEENLTFISKRTRERCMTLASHPECHKLTFLGGERLELLIGATKASQEPDPIKTTLARYEIVYDPEAQVNLAEFKLQVDAAVNSENLSKNGLQIPFEKVKNLTALGHRFDKALIKRLKDIHESGGSIQIYLDKLSLNMGAETEETGGDKRLSDVNTLSTRLIKTLDYVSKDEEELEKLDMKTLDLLWEKLRKIRELKNTAENPGKEEK